MNKHYTDIGGIPVIVFYEYFRGEKGDYYHPEIPPHTKIHDIRKENGKSVMHLIERFTDEKNYIEYLEEAITENENLKFSDWEFFNEF